MGLPLDCPNCERSLQRARSSDVGGSGATVKRELAEAGDRSDGGAERGTLAVERTLRRSGRPLDPAVRLPVERYFGRDFSEVRIHDGPRAARSAATVNARAYTVATDVVFARGEYRPETRSGRRLISHELTHVIQQEGGSPHANGETQIRGRPEGPLQRQRDDSSGVKMPADTAHKYISEYLADRPGEYVSGQMASFWVAGVLASPTTGREHDVLRFLRTLPKSSLEELLGTHGTYRSDLEVALGAPVIDLIETRFPPPDAVCGPKINDALRNVLGRVQNDFKNWGKAEQEARCRALVSFPAGLGAWDIKELFKGQIGSQYRDQGCATVAQDPPCGSTVEVDNNCYYGGSVNYVYFGKIMKLCHDAAPSPRFGISVRGSTFVENNFTRDRTSVLVNQYKGTGLTGRVLDRRWEAQSNFAPSLEWALAGYDGWPSGSMPSGDRSNCSPECEASVPAGAFTYIWKSL